MRIWPSKRTWKRIAIGIVILVAIAAIANGIMAWRIEAKLQNKIAAIRAAGYPASIAELAPQPVPESENAAAILNKLAPRFEQFSKDYYHFSDEMPLGKDYDKRGERGEPATAEQIDAIRAILNKYPDIDAGLTSAAACKKYASTADFSLDYQKFLSELLDKRISNVRTAARFIRWQMETLTAAGQQDKAIEKGIELLQLARLYDHEPLMVNMLVAIAVRGIAVDPLFDALAAGRVSPELHAALDRELALHEDPQRMARTIITERAYSIDATKVLPDTVNALQDKAGGSHMPAWLWHSFGWPMKRFYIGALDYYDILIAEFQRPWKGGRHLVAHPPAPDAPTGYGVLADLLIPATQAANTADARCTALLRCLRIFNALRVFAEKNGREAKALDELGLPNDASIDPFDGKPLRLKHTDDGWIVYTVMSDGEDDGGNFMGLKDFGVAPPRLRLTSEPEETSENDDAAKVQ
jgi:hypothetical protein